MPILFVMLMIIGTAMAVPIGENSTASTNISGKVGQSTATAPDCGGNDAAEPLSADMGVSSGLPTPTADAPAANFIATPTNGIDPFSVQFSDTSAGSPAAWDFEGDGVIGSTEQNPIHTYTVNLTATNVAGGNSTLQSDIVPVTGAPAANFAAPSGSDIEKTGYVMADSIGGILPNHRNVHVQVANSKGARFDNFGNGTYFIGSAGLKAMHVTTDPEEAYGQVTDSPDQSGTIYLTTTGGRGSNDGVILLLAVNGTIPDDFAVHIKSSGYRWEPDSIENAEFVEGALDETFTRDKFIYGPQIWRPAPSADYPFFYGQDMSDTENIFQFMFIDLNVGHIKGKADMTYRGATRVDYSFENLETFAAFDVYGYSHSANSAGWTNPVVGAGSSGYTVQGIPRVVTALTLTPAEVALGIGETLQFNATAFDQNNRVMPDASLLWSSSNEAVGVVDVDTGLFTAKAAGTTTVTVAGGETAATAEVIVTEDTPEAASIAITPQFPTVVIERGLRFSASASDAGGRLIPGAAIAWSSSNETVGTIDATGLFIARAEGETTVSAKNGDAVAETLVSVATGSPPASITIKPRELSPLYPCETVQFAATALDASGAEMDGIRLKWTSSNETVGIFDGNGHFTALAEGQTTVKAAFGGVSDSANVTVQTAPDWTLMLAGAGTETINRSGFITISAESPASCIDLSGKLWEGMSLSALVGLVDDDDPTTLNTTLASKNYKITVTYEKKGRDRTVDITSDKLCGDSVPVVANKLDGKEIRPGTYWPLVVQDGYAQYAVVKKIQLDLPRPAAVTIAPSSLALKEGQTGMFSAATLDQYGNELPTSAYTWTCSNETVGTVDENGTFTALKEGTTIVTGSDKGANATATVRVRPASHEPAVWYVDPSGNGDFTAIQAAVDGVYDYDTIVVRNGTYTESVTVDKVLTIRSEHGPEGAILNAPDTTAKALLITANDVTISGLTITGSSESYSGLAVLVKDVEGVTFSGNIIRDNWNGLFFDGCSGCTVRDNAFSGNAFAVRCERTSDCTIAGNEGADNNHGAYIQNGCTCITVGGNTFSDGDTGVSIGSKCTDNVVTENTLYNFSTTGIRVEGAGNLFTNNTIEDVSLYGFYLSNAGDNLLTGNVIDATSRAVGLIGSSSNNVFTENVFSNPTYRAIYMSRSLTNVNVFYLNDFVNVPTPTSDEGKHIWLSPDPITYTYEGNTYTARLGNYWDNYTGIDREGDGIGDAVYQIDGANDQYSPLIKPKENYRLSQPEDGTMSGRVSLKVPGCTFFADEGGKKIAIDTSLVNSTVSEDGSMITISRSAYDLVIRTDGNAPGEGDQTTWNVTGFSLTPRQLVLESDSAGRLSGSMMVNLTVLPDDAVIVPTLSISPFAGVESAFHAALRDRGLMVQGIASVLHVEKEGLEDGVDIVDATIVMNVSKAWVDAVGGPEWVRILRLDDKGRCEVLEIVCADFNEQYGYGFLANSPEGLCDFGLVAVTKVAAPSASSSSSGGGSGSDVAAISGSVPAGETRSFVVAKTAVNRIAVGAKDRISDLLVTVKKASLPKDMEAPKQTTFEVIETTLYRADPSAIDTVTLEFAVPSSWLGDHGLSTAGIILLRYGDDGWEPLPTKFMREENDRALYSAHAQGFSYFAIAADTTASSGQQGGEAVAPVATATIVAETTVPTTAPTTQQSPLPLTLPLIAFVVLFFLKRK
ncbi:NosD domain-containing protein [Methanoculleus sp. UBA303]|uniref:NosD domain-containing protein n=1 Tax=Methanoculleus sp. UBA303 TaxID=1915497 RepID=UPI0025E9952C|nr:NosD domain-containing protein [Methanoculleus sp. UBA303]